MADRSSRRSPLAGFAADGAVTMAEIPFLTQLNLRVDPSGTGGLALPVAGGTSTTSGEVSVLWLGPDEWLVVGPPAAQDRLTASLMSAAPGASVVDVSAQRTTIALAGPRVRELLAFGCSIDLHPRVFPVGACAQTVLAHAPVILWRRETAFWVLVRASFAAHLAAWLVDASLDFTAGN